MGIPGLIHAIGKGERVSLSKLAVSHLQRTARPIRVAVDISIWLFQVQAGRGGKNPELRTLFFRLLKLLALPIHPLFIYDGGQKPAFKRGKAVSGRSYGNAPIIRRSKDLIERFKFPWHEAPGEAEAECARLQQAGVVDAVMSNDVDALMFGSSLTIMNFSKEKGSGTTAATHVTCYRMGHEENVSNAPLSRAGMILFAMLSGGDYLPGGVPKVGPGLAAEIAKARFGEDLLQEIASHSPDIETRLSEWRERLQYELEENESGYFTTKHKAVRIPDTFPDQTILEYYAEPKVSSDDDIVNLRCTLRHAWDRDIDPLAIRTFAAEYFEWNYRSGARKIIKLLAEPLVCYKLRLQRPVSGLPSGTLAPDCVTPWLQQIYRTRANFGTDGTTEMQVDILPIDVVGIDLLAEEPAPLPPTEESMPSEDIGQEDEEEELEILGDEPPSTPSKSQTRAKKRYDPMAVGKIWIFETVAKLGIPLVVKKWNDEQAAKEAAKAAALAKKAAPKPKKTTTRRTGPKRKGPIDAGMKHGSILKYGTLTKENSELSSSNKSHIIGAVSSQSSLKSTQESSSGFKTPPSFAESFDFGTDFSSDIYSPPQGPNFNNHTSHEVDSLIDSFSSLLTASPISKSSTQIKRRPMARPPPMRACASIPGTGEVETAKEDFVIDDTVASPIPRGLRISYSVNADEHAQTTAGAVKSKLNVPLPKKPVVDKPKTKKHVPVANTHCDVVDLEAAVGSLSLSARRDNEHSQNLPVPRIKDSYLNNSEELATKSSPSKQKPKTKKKNTESKKSNGHLENISTHNGFWSIDEPNETNADEATSNNRESTSNAGGDQNKNRKKRVPRVSILDLI
ncbi:hypothetical protein N7478_009718 [Penicillium angulare]|uniref:uncharacterized protein n=1 Tax=Penicillium angulare TaxID=116970 RepID=UPI00253F9C61|nr:uncharacterized protein N7478_009718 [Penicillium angulare]KAJ5266910.1 hypothetical protein N7478_009718 [Penicillium angulare]